METDMANTDSEGWFSKVAGSATSLTRDLLSLNSSYETTDDLTVLRSAHKAGYQAQNDSTRLDRQQRLLSSRHRNNGTFRSPRRSLDLLEEAELEDELVYFLGEHCSISDGFASSSRSGSPQSGVGGETDLIPNRSGVLKWSESVAPEIQEQRALNVPAENSTLQHNGGEASQGEGLDIALQERASNAVDLSQTTHPTSKSLSTSSLKANDSVHPLAHGKVASQAARRLELISHHLSLVNWDQPRRLRPATLADFTDFETSLDRLSRTTHEPLLDSTTRANLSDLESSYTHITSLTQKFTTETPTVASLATFESSYNHIAGLMHQDTSKPTTIAGLSNFESSYHHVSILNERFLQASSTTSELQSESTHSQFCPGEMSAEWADFLAQGPYCLKRDHQKHADGCSTPTQHSTQRVGILPDLQAYSTLEQMGDVVQKGKQREEQKREAEEDLMPPFHCPWVGCQHFFDTGYQYIRSATGELEGLACVHVECDEAFIEEAEWREHILSPHHGLLRTPPNEPSNEDAFDKAWEVKGAHV